MHEDQWGRPHAHIDRDSQDPAPTPESPLSAHAGGGLEIAGLENTAVPTRRTAAAAPCPLVAGFDPAARGFTRLLGGPPATFVTRAGHVALGPGESVGRHNTREREEVIVVLEGEGRLSVAGSGDLPLHAGAVAYCPPRTDHDVVNVGSGPLRYVYVVCMTASPE